MCLVIRQFYCRNWRVKTVQLGSIHRKSRGLVRRQSLSWKKKRCVESKINFTLNYFFSSCDRLDPNGDRMHFGWCNNGKIWPETTIRAYERVVRDRLDDTVFQCKLLRLTTGSVRDGFLCGTSVAVRVRLHKWNHSANISRPISVNARLHRLIWHLDATCPRNNFGMASGGRNLCPCTIDVLYID